MSDLRISNAHLARIVQSVERRTIRDFSEALATQREEIAQRCAALVLDALRERDEGPPMLTPAEAGARLGKSAQWVRDHRDELGVVELGNGSRPRLGVPAERLAAYIACLTSRRTDGADDGSAKPSKRGRAAAGKGRDASLLPIRGKAPSR